MESPNPLHLSRRERQIMDLLFRLGSLTAAGVQSHMDDAPSYSAVRAHLASLERKGLVRHASEDSRYVYSPVMPAERARRNALRHLVETFFGGSPSRAVAALLDDHSAELSEEELKRLSELIEKARAEGL